ncbi:hypothetical protein DFJ73DRAFT_364697 [Zopfochytrium polystomum]|nr:hypothetical protein DFJ73DRAFT_364697 [Zopfochytrium polystomum]
MVILGAYAIYNLVVVILTIPWLWNPFVWVLFLLEVVNLLLNGFGFWAVYRLIPEWMVMYGWFILIFLVVRVVEVVTYVILGAAASSITKLIFAVLFTISMIACLFSLRAYAQACRGLSI